MSHSMPVAVCAKMVEAASKSCAVPQSSPPAPTQPQPEWDALANSIASLSSAFAWGSLLLAVVAILGALTWGWIVKGWAEKEAKQEAERCAKQKIDAWLTDEAPNIVRRHVEMLNDASTGNVDDKVAADKMGEAAG